MAPSTSAFSGGDPAGGVSEEPRGAGAGDPETDQGVPMLVTQGTELLKNPDPGYARDTQLELGDTEPSENPSKKDQGVETTTQQGSSPQLAVEEETRNLADQEEEKVEGEEKEKVDEEEEDVGKQKEKADDEEEKTDAQKEKVDTEEEKVNGDEGKMVGEDEDEDAAADCEDFSELMQEVMRLLRLEEGGWS